MVLLPAGMVKSLELINFLVILLEVFVRMFYCLISIQISH